MSRERTDGAAVENTGRPDEARIKRNERAADRERERQSVEAVRHLTEELHTLIELRGRIATAEAILSRNGDVALALKALCGERLW